MSETFAEIFEKSDAKIKELLKAGFVVKGMGRGHIARLAEEVKAKK